VRLFAYCLMSLAVEAGCEEATGRLGGDAMNIGH
jgi:hypothetical protein